jgi:hypothetical protein
MRVCPVVATALLLAASACSVDTSSAMAASPSAPSAIGAQAVQWLTVSPQYRRTGLVVAMGSPLTNCSSNCMQLWVSHDGGASWKPAAAHGWQGGRPVIAVDRQGHDVLVAGSGVGLQRSTDGGATWANVASGGSALPALSPTFASTGTVAMANPEGHDYVHSNQGDRLVRGSGGGIVDLSFMYAPTVAASGRFASALLSGADPQTKLPVVERCDANLSCSEPAQLPGASGFSAPATLIPSTDYAHDGVVFAQSGRGLYKSIDGGATFAPLTLVPTNGATATATPMLALASGYREAGPIRSAYAAVFQAYVSQSNPHSAGGVYETDDAGATWHPLGSPGPLDGGVMSVAVAPDGRLFAGYVSSGPGGANAGLLCSEDAGHTWRASCSSVGAGAVSAVHGGSMQGGSKGSGTCSSQACSADGSAPAGNPSTGETGAGSGAGQDGVALAAGRSHPGGGTPGGALAIGAVGVAALLGGLSLWRLRKERNRTSVRHPGG